MDESGIAFTALKLHSVLAWLI